MWGSETRANKVFGEDRVRLQRAHERLDFLGHVRGAADQRVAKTARLRLAISTSQGAWCETWSQTLPISLTATPSSPPSSATTINRLRSRIASPAGSRRGRRGAG